MNDCNGFRTLGHSVCVKGSFFSEWVFHVYFLYSIDKPNKDGRGDRAVLTVEVRNNAVVGRHPLPPRYNHAPVYRDVTLEGTKIDPAQLALLGKCCSACFMPFQVFLIMLYCSDDYRMKFNINKTKIMVIRRKSKKIDMRTKDEPIEQVDSFKYLKCNISSNLNCC